MALCLLLALDCILAQSQKNGNYAFTTHIFAAEGKILTHHPYISELIEGRPVLRAISFQKNTFGDQHWQLQHRYPSYGFTVSWTDYKNPAQLGHSFQVTPFFKFPIIRTRSYKLHVSTSWGIGYVTKIFDPVLNYKNNLLGSHWNAVGLATLENSLQIAPRLSVKLNLLFFHISNGSIKKPNQGINMPMLSAGIELGLGSWSSFPKKETLTVVERSRQWRLNVQYLGGLKQTFPIGTKSYWCSSLGVLVRKNFGRISIFQSGLELFYLPALHQDLSERGVAVRPQDLFRLGIPLYYGIDIDKLKLWFCWGIYAYDSYRIDGNFYHRAGFSYEVFKNLDLQFSLKTHYAKADYFEVGLRRRL